MLLTGPDLVCMGGLEGQPWRVHDEDSTAGADCDPEIPKVAMEINVGYVCEKCRNTGMSLW